MDGSNGGRRFWVPLRMAVAIPPGALAALYPRQRPRSVQVLVLVLGEEVLVLVLGGGVLVLLPILGEEVLVLVVSVLVL